MTIYQILNTTAGKYDYVTDDQPTVTANASNALVNTIVLGDATVAAATLAANQKAFLTAQAYRFTANKTIVSGAQTVVTGVDLATEPANTDQIYNVYNDLAGQYTQVTGTDALAAQIEATKTALLKTIGLDQYTIVTEVPQPKVVQPATTGTQTV